MAETNRREGDRPDPQPARRRWKWVRRAVKASGCLVVLVLLAFVGLYVTRESTLHPMLVRSAPTLGRWFTDYDISIGSIEGDWTSRLRIGDLEVTPRDEPAVFAGLTARELEVTGPLIALARGAADRSDLLVSGRELDVTVDTTAIEPDPGAEPATGGPLDVIAGYGLNVAESTFVLRTANDTLTFERIDLRGRSNAFEPLDVRTDISANDWAASVHAQLVSTSDGIAFEGDVSSGKARGVELEVQGLAGEYGASLTRIDSGTVVLGENRAVARDVVIRSSADDGTTAGGTLELNLPDIASARAVIAAVTGRSENLDWSGSATGAVTLTPAPGKFATGRLRLDGTDVVVEGVRLGALTAELHADDDTVEIIELVATDGVERIEATGSYLHGTREIVALALDFELDQPERHSPGLAFLSGVNGTARVSGPIDSLAGTFRFRAGVVEAGQFTVRDVDVEAELADGVVDLKDVRATTDVASLELRAKVTLPDGDAGPSANVETLVLDGAEGNLALAESTRVSFPGGAVVVEPLVLSGTAGSLSLEVDTRTRTGSDADPSSRPAVIIAKADDLHVGAFIHALVDERIDVGRTHGSIHLWADPPRGDIDLRIEGAALARAEDRIALEFIARWSDGIADIQRIAAELDGATVALSGKAPLELLSEDGVEFLGDGDVDMQADVKIDSAFVRTTLARDLLLTGAPAWVSRLEGGAHADMQLSGSWSDLRGHVGVELLDVALPRLPTKDGDRFGSDDPWLPAPLAGRVELDVQDTIRIHDSDLELGEFASITLLGELDRALDVIALRGDPSELDAWRDAKFDATGSVACEDLEWVAAFFPSLRDTGGRIEVQGQVHGTLNEPEPSGILVWKDGRTRLEGAPAIDNVDFELKLLPDQIRIEHASFELGAAPVTASGNMLLGQGEPRLDFKLVGQDVLLARSRNARLRANIAVDIEGRSTSPRVKGDISLVGGRLRSPVEFQRFLRVDSSGPASVRRGYRIPSFGPKHVKLDLRVTTEEAIKLEGRITRGSIRCDLAILGDAREPVPQGSIYFDPLEVAVPAGSIEFPTGFVRFEPEAPEIPEVDLVGTTRLAGYDVTVNVSGPYDEPAIDLSSSPPLPPEDLLLLVLSGQPPSAGASLEAAGQSVALYVAKDLVRGWMNSGGFEDSDRESFLDRLEVVTGRDVSRSGAITIEATYRLREGFARKKDALYAVLERDAFEDYNIGVRLVLRLR